MITHGFFGKLPTIGDFVGRGWPSSSKDGLDRILQEALGKLLDTNDGGKETISDAPRFVLSIRPNIVSDQGIIALVVPSQDRVGRTYPLCAGVQWSEEGDIGDQWPSVEYAQALAARLDLCVAAQSDPEDLLAEIVDIGDPRDFRPTFFGLAGDETMPKLGMETTLVQIGGPERVMSPALVALCAILGQSSDLLGIRFDAKGEVLDFFVCRRLDSSAPLAAVFDGQWSRHGWATYPRAARDVAVERFDDDTTHPGTKAIDFGVASVDSAGAAGKSDN